ncbi:UbiA family prenyltransferase [Patescibacteria group bacterium]|nr:UbiA family prenyltransferase [Patescibacteria group bacterium]MBU1890886.1 UbiA family prenyltransferase [Patescibacteria group bacterium]
MRSFYFWFRVCRPHNCLTAALGTWIIALLSNGPEWITSVKLAASLSMGIGCLGASLFHYGAANKMYARKHWDNVEVENPKLLIVLGLLAFAVSILLALMFLPTTTWFVVFYNTIAIVLYSRVLSRHWVTKNVVIAVVCTTPILLGWLSGQRLHSAVPFGIITIFCAYWAREIVKDVTDIEANQGIRVTLPIWLGIVWARRIAGIFASLGFISLLALGNQLKTESTLVTLPYLCSLPLFFMIAYSLLKRRTNGREARWILAGTWLIMISFLGLRFSLL